MQFFNNLQEPCVSKTCASTFSIYDRVLTAGMITFMTKTSWYLKTKKSTIIMKNQYGGAVRITAIRRLVIPVTRVKETFSPKSNMTNTCRSIKLVIWMVANLRLMKRLWQNTLKCSMQLVNFMIVIM